MSKSKVVIRSVKSASVDSAVREIMEANDYRSLIP